MKRTRYRKPWWTKERVVEGLRRFHLDFGVAPTSTEEYQKRQQFTGPNPRGAGNPYPSAHAVLKYFATFRQAWAAVGIETERFFGPWTAEEDRFLSEAIGIFSRKEIAEALDRTPDAVHTRICDLGLHAYRARGWTFSRVMTATGVPDYIIRRYADRGDLPYFRGTKCCYLDPADLLVVKEIDWDGPPAELAAAVRRSIMTKLVMVLRGQDWRAGRLYQVQKKTITDKRRRRNVIPAGPKPVEIDKGDWVTVNRLETCPELSDRVGYVHTVYWSSYGSLSNKRRAGGKPAWVARVEFKGDKGQKRLNRILPLEILRPAPGRTPAAGARAGSGNRKNGHSLSTSKGDAESGGPA